MQQSQLFVEHLSYIIMMHTAVEGAIVRKKEELTGKHEQCAKALDSDSDSDFIYFRPHVVV